MLSTALRPFIRAGAALLVACAVLAAGCVHRPTPARTTTSTTVPTRTTRPIVIPPASLDGTWVLVPSDLTPVPAGVELYMVVDGDHAAIHAGCHVYSATLAIDRGRRGFIDFDQSVGTPGSGCADDVINADYRLTRALDSVDNYEQLGSELLVWGPRTDVRFRRASVDPATGVVAGTWMVMTVRDRGTGAVDPQHAAEPAAVKLTTNGLGVLDICWSSPLEWSVTGDTIAVRIVGGFDTECRDPAERLDEPNLLVALENADRWSLDGDTLTLSTDTGQVTLTARRVLSAG